MSAATLAAFIARCRLLCRPGPHVSDAELLERFTHQRDADAFAQLLERHACLVWGVCRRILAHESDCEDAFQATFLALLRRPGAIDPRQSLAAWLHTVALRVSLKALVRSRRQQQQSEIPGRTTVGDVADEVGNRELFRIVDEEIERLPAAVRAPLILCCLEGRTRDEAAQALGCSASAVKGRLERGRELLRRNLERRGVELPAAFLVLGLTGQRIRACLWAKTMQSALHTPAPGIASLAEASVSAAAMGKCKVLLGALLLAISTAGVVRLLRLEKPEETPASPPAQTVVEAEQAGATENRTDRQGDPLPPDAITRLGTVRLRHGVGVVCVAFSSDGKMVAAGGMGRAVSLWDAATGKELRRFASNRGQPARVAFSPDGKILASVSQANSLVCLYDANTGKELRLLQGHQSGVSCLAFSSDGKFLASGDNQGTIRLWKPVVANLPPRRPGLPDEEVRHVSGEWGAVQALTFSPDGKLLAFAGEDGKIRLWNARTGDEMRRLNGHPKAISSLSFSPDGKLLASAGLDQTIRLWAAATGEQVRVLGEKLAIGLCVAFSPDGRSLASAHRDGTLAVLDPHTGRIIRTWQGHDFAATSVTFSPDGKRLASGGARDSSVRIWDAASGKERNPIDAHRAGVDLVRWLPDGNTLISIDRTSHVLWWDLPTQRPRRRVVHPHPVWSAFALAGDNDTLATGGLSDYSLRLTTIASDKLGRLLGKQESMIGALALSPDGRLLAAGGRDQALRLWDVSNGREIRRFEGPGNLVWCAAFSPDSKKLAYGIIRIGNNSNENTVKLVDAASGKLIHVLAGRGRATCMVFSPDGKILASWHDGFPDKSLVCLWDVESGKELCRHSGHPAGEGAISFSPDGKLAASAVRFDENSDPVIHLWEAATGRLIRRFAGHQSGVSSLAFSPDGLRLASGGGDSTILVWDITGRRAGGHGRLKPLTPRELDACWAALANEDTAKAYDSVWALVAAPEQAAPFLQKHLQPVPHPDARQIARWIEDLDSDDFTVRQKATEELSKLGGTATFALRRALDGEPSLELRRRVEQLLDQSRGWTPERLRHLRAIQALEHLNTVPARQVLQVVADGAPGACRTEEAKAALRRIPR